MLRNEAGPISEMFGGSTWRWGYPSEGGPNLIEASLLNANSLLNNPNFEAHSLHEKLRDALKHPVTRVAMTSVITLFSLLVPSLANPDSALAQNDLTSSPPGEPEEEVPHEVPEGLNLPPLEPQLENNVSDEQSASVEQPERFETRWTSHPNLPQNSEQEAFTTDKVADWLETMHKVHPELDRLATLFEQANHKTGNERARAYFVSSASRDIALRNPRTWYNPVIFSPFKDSRGRSFSDFFFYYDAFAVGRGHDSPLDFALAIFNWQTAKGMLDSGISAEEVVRKWNSVEVVGIYADNMDKVISIFREIRDSGIFSVAELDQFSGFWDDPRSILKGMSGGNRFEWLAIVRNIFNFPYENADLARLA